MNRVSTNRVLHLKVVTEVNNRNENGEETNWTKFLYEFWSHRRNDLVIIISESKFRYR